VIHVLTPTVQGLLIKKTKPLYLIVLKKGFKNCLTLVAPKLLKLLVLFFSMSWPSKVVLRIRISTLYPISKAFFRGGGVKWRGTLPPPPGYQTPQPNL